MDIQEHIYKEMLKQIINNSPNYTEKIKCDLCSIVDAGNTPEEIIKSILTYFATYRWY